MRSALAVLALLICAPAQAQLFDDESPPPALVASFPLNTSGTIATPTATMGITFDRAVAATYAAEVGAQTFTVNSTPVKVADGTWPSGLSGTQGNAWKFDGSDDYLSAGPANPAGSFSVFAVVTPDTTTGDQVILGTESTTVGGYMIYRSAGTLYFEVCEDALRASCTTITKALCLAAGRQTVIGATYQYVGSGSSVMNLYCSELAVANSNTAKGPSYGTEAMVIGTFTDHTIYFFDGAISHVAYYAGTVLTSTQIATIRNTWRGTLSTKGAAVSTTSATPPAAMLAPPGSGTEPFFVEMPVNTVQVGSPASGSGGLYSPAAITNLAQRGSFETLLTGWTEAPTSTGDCANSTASMAHGSAAARCTNADADDAITLTSACLTVTEATAYYVSAYAKKVSGTALLDINILEDDSADCGSITTTTAVVNDAVPTTSWARQGGTITTGAGIIRAQVQISLPAAAAQVLDIDGVMLRAWSTPTDALCVTDADASAVCTAVVPPITPSPVPMGPASLTVTARTPSAASALWPDHATLLADGTPAGANTLHLITRNDTFDPGFRVYDGTGGILFLLANVQDWAANTDYTVRAKYNNAGGMSLAWPPGTWINGATGGAGTGIRAATQTYLYLGSTNTTPSDVWTRDLLVYRRMMP